MAIVYPTLSTRKINVAMKLGNRQDLLQPAPGSNNTYSRISGWLRDAYISIGMSTKFKDMQKSTTIQLVPGQDTYPYPSDCRAILSLVGVRQDTGASIPVL